MAGDDVLCIQVEVQPQLLGLAVEALPESLLERTVLSKVLPRESWDALRRAAYKRSGLKCAPTPHGHPRSRGPPSVHQDSAQLFIVAFHLRLMSLFSCLLLHSSALHDSVQLFTALILLSSASPVIWCVSRGHYKGSACDSVDAALGFNYAHSDARGHAAAPASAVAICLSQQHARAPLRARAQQHTSAGMLRSICLAPESHTDGSAGRCEVSGGVGSEWPVSASPLWEVDDDIHTVTLTGIAALAPQVRPSLLHCLLLPSCRYCCFQSTHICHQTTTAIISAAANALLWLCRLRRQRRSAAAAVGALPSMATTSVPALAARR